MSVLDDLALRQAAPQVKAPALSIRHVWIAMTLIAAFIGPASTPISSPDGMWSLLRGRWMADHGALLNDDPFTSAPHLPGPALNVQWLADVVLHAFEAIGGLPLVITLAALVVVATYALVLVATYTASERLRLSCVAVWCAYALGATNLSPRPQTLSYLLFAVFLLAIVRVEWRADARLLWLLPLVTAVWANIHGSFFLGMLLLACAAGGRVLDTRGLAAGRPYLLALIGCLLASLLNPYGPGALVYVATLSTNPVVRDYITEWAPTTLSGLEGSLFFGSIMLIGGLVLRTRTQLRLTGVEIVWLLVFGLLAWSSVRVLVWWGMLIAPTLARLLSGALPVRPRHVRDRPLINALVIGGAILIAALSLPWTKSHLPNLPLDKQGIVSRATPVGVAAYLKTHAPPPSGRMFNHQVWGGYLEWATWPEHQVFVDGRIELHPAEVWLDYLRIVFPSASWRALLAKYDVSYAVLDRTEEADLVADLRADPAWRLDYEDEQAVVLTRVDH